MIGPLHPAPDSWITHIPSPRNFAQLAERLRRHGVTKVDPNQVHGNFLNIVMELVFFREALQNGTYQHPLEIIQQAQTIDNDLAQFAQHMPSRTWFQSFRDPPQSLRNLVYKEYYHGEYKNI
jgi:hypothetical protein